MTLEQWLGRIVPRSPSPLAKQLPTTLGFALAAVVWLVVPDDGSTGWVLFGVSMGVVVAATVLAAAVPWERVDPHWLMAVPLLSMVAVALLRMATGGSASPFGVLLVLPFVWIATGEKRSYALLAALATFPVLIAPFFLVGYQDSNLLLRSLFSPVIYAAVALVVNDFVHQLRQQTQAAQANADELARNQAQLREAYELNRSIWNAITEQSIISTDLHGRINVWNPGAEKILGLTEAEVLSRGASVVDFHKAAELERAGEGGASGGADAAFAALIPRDSAAKSAKVWDWTYVRADGTEIPVQLSVTPRLDGDGNQAGYIFVATDMTRAQEFARMKDEFIGLVSHELRTPLTAIFGYLDLMQDDPLTEDQTQYLAIVDRNARQLLALVGDLLFTAQVESGVFALKPQQVDLTAIAGAAVESATPAAAHSGVELRAAIEAGPCLTQGDPMRLAQAIDNLVSNAIKFTPRGGSVTVALQRDQGEDRITVTDTGIGIPAEEIELLTQRFFRASTAVKNGVPGVGLGLTITQAIVAAHQGSLEVRSTEGEGTSFILHLPRVGEADGLG